MKNERRRKSINIRLFESELQEIARIHELAVTDQTRADFIRDVLLGKQAHPYAKRFRNHNLDVKDYGKLEGGHENLVHYQTAILAAEFLMLIHDPKYKKVISSNKEMFERMTTQMRGYHYDEKRGVKTPLTDIE